MIRSWTVAGTVAVFAAGLLTVGVLRYLEIQSDDPLAVAAHATLIYVGLTIVASLSLVRAGVPLGRLGFGVAIQRSSVVALALLGVAILQLGNVLLADVWAHLFDAGRDLSRFSDGAGAPGAVVRLLVLSWTVAAFGEELAFRIVLMRGTAYALGDGRGAVALALVLQAIVFGLVHAYQGPVGIASTAFSGVVLGGLTLAARWSIWPAALAHGVNNTIGIVRLYSA